jgi:hypothetical protein
MNAGQMVEEVRCVVRERVPVRFLGHLGGVIPMSDEIEAELAQLACLSGRAALS